MVQPSIDIRGVEALVRNVNDLSRNFEKSTLRTALRNAARPVLKRAKSKVPVDRGNLRRNLATTAKVDKRGQGTAKVGYRVPDAAYGNVVETGTSKFAAQPYLRPALKEAHEAGEVDAAFINAINATINKRLKKAGVR